MGFLARSLNGIQLPACSCLLAEQPARQAAVCSPSSLLGRQLSARRAACSAGSCLLAEQPARQATVCLPSSLLGRQLSACRAACSAGHCLPAEKPAFQAVVCSPSSCLLAEALARRGACSPRRLLAEQPARQATTCSPMCLPSSFERPGTCGYLACLPWRLRVRVRVIDHGQKRPQGPAHVRVPRYTGAISTHKVGSLVLCSLFLRINVSLSAFCANCYDRL
ncbi:hypothetical protein PCANC_25440 [Puccinia coronata f. sp. avenae]|uniref:Uncharacterized protein n=1 Tax=Puccinia coronata f. sp. avenae TaxID=200324 RepID=A0A2N5TMY2_9BASI|nr:hypothetical protein PCANC_25440 [Puccinia coronata f. sp. avenae]